MRALVWRQLTYANVAATFAAFVALGGGAFAAGYVVTSSNQIKDGVITGSDVKNNSLSSADMKDGSLVARDFAPGVLPGARLPADVQSGGFGANKAVQVTAFRGDDEWTKLESFALRPGSYLGSAIVHLKATGSASAAGCQLVLGLDSPVGGVGGWAFTAEGNVAQAGGVTLVMQRAATLVGSGDATVYCWTDAVPVTADQVSLLVESMGSVVER